MINKKKQRVAVFDIDGTIFRSSLLIELVEALIAEGTFASSIKKSYQSVYQKWLDRKGSYDDYIWGVIKAFDKNIRGVPEKDFLRAVTRVMHYHQDRVYRYTRDLVKDLKKKGYFLLAISHSPKYAVEPFAKNFGFDKTYGLLFELDARSRFTGSKLYFDMIMNKAAILERAAEKENLSLRGSVGVGDSESDIKFLKMVARPIAFNPNLLLYKYASKHNWEVVVERKNVIYHVGKKETRPRSS